MKKKNLWFHARHFGFGWRPISWEGWVVTIIYVLGLLNYIVLDDAAHSGSDFLLAFAPHFIFLSIIFLLICYVTGERPRWRWGK